MEAPIEKLARLRLRLTQSMLHTDKSSAHYQDLVKQEVGNIQDFGITQAEFQAFNCDPQLRHLVTASTQPESSMEMTNKMFYRVQERRNHFTQVLKNKEQQLEAEEQKASVTRDLLDQRMMESLKRSQSVCQTKVEKIRQLKKSFDRQLHQQKQEEETELIRQGLNSKEERWRQSYQSQTEQKMQHIQNLHDQRNQKFQIIQQNLQTLQQKETENSNQILQKLYNRDKHVEMTKSDRLDELKIRRINLETRLRDAQERSSIAKQQLEDTKRTIALKNMAPREIPARSPPSHQYQSKRSYIEQLTEERQSYLEKKIRLKDKQQDDRREMFKAKMAQFYQNRKQDRDLDTQQVLQQKKDLEEIDDYYKRLHYFKLQEKSDNFIRSRSQMQETLRSWSRYPDYKL